MFQKTIETHVEAANLEKFVKFRHMIWRKRYGFEIRGWWQTRPGWWWVPWLGWVTVDHRPYPILGAWKRLLESRFQLIGNLFSEIDFQNTKLTFSKWYSTLIYTSSGSFLIVHRKTPCFLWDQIAHQFAQDVRTCSLNGRLISRALYFVF